jgi:hypothetical protein
VAKPVVAPVEDTGIPCEKGPHDAGQGAGSGPNQEMGVVGQEGPGIDGQARSRGKGRKTLNEVIPVTVISKDGPAFDAPHHDMVQDTRGI